MLSFVDWRASTRRVEFLVLHRESCGCFSPIVNRLAASVVVAVGMWATCVAICPQRCDARSHRYKLRPTGGTKPRPVAYNRPLGSFLVAKAAKAMSTWPSARLTMMSWRSWRRFRLCDAFLVQELVVCGANVELHKRRLVQAARGTHCPGPRPARSEAVADAKARGTWVVVAEQTTASVRPVQLVPMFPVKPVLGGERSGSRRKQ